MRRVAVLLMAAVAALVVPAAALRGGSGTAPGQIPPGPPATPIPTTPCSGCGPTPGTHGTKPFAWSYTEHFCPAGTTYGPEGSAVYGIIYGLGAQTTGAATFYGQINGILRTLNTLNPGERAVEFPAIAVPQGVTFQLEMWATPAGSGPSGPRIPWGNGTDSKLNTLTCDCATPSVQSAPPSPTTPGSTPPLVNTVPPGSFPFPPSL